MKRSTARFFALRLLPAVLLLTSIDAFAFGDDGVDSRPSATTSAATSDITSDATARLQEAPALSDAVQTNAAPRPTKSERLRVVLRPGPERDAAADAGIAATPNGDGDNDGDDARTLVGREIADYRTDDGGGHFVLEDELGEIRVFENARIESIETAPEIDAQELRSEMAARLLEEFGEGFQTKTTDRYLFVYNVSEGYVEWCSRLFDNLNVGFEKFAEKNAFDLTERSEPLIVAIFATRREFDQYAAKETPDPSRVVAYYNMQTNRVVLYDLSGIEGVRDESARRRRSYQEIKEILSRPNAAFNVATIVHEATHQIAFNRGVFLRTGPFPLWAVEGLSLVFETPNGRTTQGGWSYRGFFPTNERQLALFQNFAARSNEGDPLRDLIRQDRFMRDLQGSYSSSWALFYYLYKKKPKELAKYLRKIAAMPPYLQYSPEDRVADFEEFFGDDWEKLYKSLSRFIRSL